MKNMQKMKSFTVSGIIRVCIHTVMSRNMIKLTKWLCAQRRLKSAWAAAQADQSLYCVLNG